MKLSLEKNYFLAAVMFFTRLPVPKNCSHSDDILNQSRKYFPLVGLFIGCLGAASVFFLQLILPLSIAILLSMVITILATGAFHEDGFADSCDGFGGGWKKEQVLTIMKDSRVGTYAVVGLILLLSVKFFALTELGLLSIPLLLITYINGHAISRLGASFCVQFSDYVQDIDKSKSKSIAENPLSARSMLYSTLLIAPAFLFLLLQNFFFIVTLIPLVLLFLIINAYFKKRIGGYTGDCLGAMQQLLEVIFYLSVLALN